MLFCFIYSDFEIEICKRMMLLQVIAEIFMSLALALE
jgi:hypothetical protein